MFTITNLASYSYIDDKNNLSVSLQLVYTHITHPNTPHYINTNICSSNTSELRYSVLPFIFDYTYSIASYVQLTCGRDLATNLVIAIATVS